MMVIPSSCQFPLWPATVSTCNGQGFENWQDPRSTGGSSGLAITSDWLTRPLELKSDARIILVVEKDGVFNRMVEDGFYDRQFESQLLNKHRATLWARGRMHGL